MRRVIRRPALVVVCAMALVAAGCADNQSVSATRSNDAVGATAVVSTTAMTDSTVAPAIEVPTTYVPVTTVAPTTEAPPVTEAAATTAPTTAPTTVVTEAPTTTVAAGIPSGWVEGSFPEGSMAGCCEYSYWTGTPSPAFPDDPAAPLADGVYTAAVVAPWTAAQPNQLSIEVRRIEQCTILGEAACIEPGPYVDTDVITADSPTRTLTVALDDTLAVGLSGFDNCRSLSKSANGNDLVALFAAFDSAYRSEIGSKLAAGEPEEQIAAELTAAPASGFEPISPVDCGGVFVFRSGDAPPLLMQVIAGYIDDNNRPPLTPTDQIHLVSIVVTNGQPSLYFYSGFYS